MDVITFTRTATTRLATAGIETARLDVLVLAEAALQKDRTQLLAHPEIKIPPTIQNLLNEQIDRRARHEPLAFVLKRSEFYGREFIVSPDVLVPRPESETMVDLLKELITAVRTRLQKQASATLESAHTESSEPGSQLTGWDGTSMPVIQIADIGTGSGALGITAALELQNVSVDLLEIDDKALQIAKRNVIKHTTGIPVIKSDLLTAAPHSYNVLLCNLPYVPDEYPINQAATFEPNIALFGGPDGLDLYRELFLQIANVQSKPLLILTEALPEQHEALQTIALKSGYIQTSQHNFIQAFCPN